MRRYDRELDGSPRTWVSPARLELMRGEVEQTVRDDGADAIVALRAADVLEAFRELEWRRVDRRRANVLADTAIQLGYRISGLSDRIARINVTLTDLRALHAELRAEELEEMGALP